MDFVLPMSMSSTACWLVLELGSGFGVGLFMGPRAEGGSVVGKGRMSDVGSVLWLVYGEWDSIESFGNDDFGRNDGCLCCGYGPDVACFETAHELDLEALGEVGEGCQGHVGAVVVLTEVGEENGVQGCGSEAFDHECGLGIGEVSAPTGDAVFEVVGVGSVPKHILVVVGFEESEMAER